MRKQLAILAAAFAFAFAGHAGTVEARDGVYRSVAVDTSRIAVRGHQRFAAAIKPMLAGELSKALGNRLGSTGGQLIVRITRIELPPSAGENSWGGAIDDVIEGVVIVPGRGQIPIRVTLPPNAGAWYASNFDERRVYRLIEAFAQWAAREA